MTPPEVVVSGYTSVDRIVRVTTPLRPGFTSLISNKDNAKPRLGGCSVNIACGLGHLGHRAAPCIRVGDDAEGELTVALLTEAGASCAGVRVIPSETTSNCYLLEDEGGNHVTVYYPGAMDGRYALPPSPSLFENAKLAVMTVGARPDNREFLTQCRRFRLPLAFGMKADLDAFPVDFLKEILEYSTIIFLNHSERATIQKMFEMESITELFGSGNLQRLVVTDGTRGSHCHELVDGTVVRTTVPVVEENTFATALGAGDAYIAGFLAGYLEGKPSATCAWMGSTLASFAVEEAGACEGLPTREQFLQRLDSAVRPLGKEN